MPCCYMTYKVKDKGSVMCNEHKLPGMTNVRKRRAMERLSKLKDPSNSSFGNHSQSEILHSQQQAQAAAAIAAAAAAAAAASSAAQQQAQLEEGVGPVSVLGDYYESFQATQTGGASFAVSSAESSSAVAAAAADTVAGVYLEDPHSRDGNADLGHHQDVDGKEAKSASMDEHPLGNDSGEQTYDGSSVPHEELSPCITGLPTSPLCSPPEELGHVDGSSGEVVEVLTKAASNNR